MDFPWIARTDLSLEIRWMCEEIESELGPDTDEVVGSLGLDHCDLVR
jgi:hypothetical protein